MDVSRVVTLWYGTWLLLTHWQEPSQNSSIFSAAPEERTFHDS